jgi:hypothetical protein
MSIVHAKNRKSLINSVYRIFPDKLSGEIPSYDKTHNIDILLYNLFS